MGNCKKKRRVDERASVTNSRIVTFVVGTEKQEFLVQQETFAGISPYFNVLLTNGLTCESLEARVVWDDIEVETFRSFLRFVYTGQMGFIDMTNVSESNATDESLMSISKVIVLADRYDICELGKQCEILIGKKCHRLVQLCNKTKEVLEDLARAIGYLSMNTLRGHNWCSIIKAYIELDIYCLRHDLTLVKNHYESREAEKMESESMYYTI